MKRAAALGFLVFLGLWIAGFLRTWVLPYPQPPAWQLPYSEESSARLPSANNLRQIGLEQTPLPLMLEQPDVEKIRVYEKNAHLAAGTAAFDDDLVLVRSALTAHQAAVFNEKNGGIAPERRITLEIGVHPDKFDALVDKLRHIARLESVSVQQRDRTGEFRRLNAQRQALNKHLESVLKLRSAKSPSIDDALKLEQKIQDIEKELQGLSVQLGELLGKESFYHIYVTLFEYQPGSQHDRTYTTPKRLVHGFLWALAWWFAAALALGLLGATYLSIQTLWPGGTVAPTERSRPGPT